MKNLNFKWLLAVLYCGLILSFFLYQGEENLVLNLTVYLIAPLSAVFAGIITLRRLGWQGRRAAVLKYVLFGLFLWLFGELVILYFAQEGMDPYPSIADALFLAGYALFSAAVISEAKLFDLHWKKIDPQVLWGLGSGLALVVGVVGYIAVTGYDSESGLLVSLTTISWSIGDLIMGGLALVLLAMAWNYREGMVKREWLWFILAALVNLVADTIYNLSPEAMLEGTNLTLFLNSLWSGAYFLLAGYFLQLNSELKKMQTKIKEQGEALPRI
jgi:hypothetical protein